jgi:hypothetical protein
MTINEQSMCWRLLRSGVPTNSFTVRAEETRLREVHHLFWDNLCCNCPWSRFFAKASSCLDTA